MSRTLVFCDVYKKGAAVMTVVVFLAIISVVMVVGLSSPVVREHQTARDFEKSKGAYYLSEAGLEDAIYRVREGVTISSQEEISLAGNTATTTITAVSPTKKTISSIGAITANTRRSGTTLSVGAGEDFVYAMLVGPFGLYMGKNATINGNVYSGGPICAGGIEIWATDRCLSTSNLFWWDYTTSLITGSVVSTGTTGSNGWIARVRNQDGNSMYAGTITNSTISGDAYCNNIYTSSKSTCNTLPSQPVYGFPLSDEDITAFEAAATAGGVEGGGCYPWAWPHYRITTSKTIGPRKFPCHVYIEGPYYGTPITITLQGPVWVLGNITITGKVNVRVDPSYTGQSIPMIADLAGYNHNTNIYLNDGYQKVFTGATGGNSWIALISTDTGVSQGDPYDNAIAVGNNVSGDVILYANRGMIDIGSSSVAEISGYGVHLEHNAVVNYVLGLQSVLFYEGPGGTWTLEDWKSGE